METTNAFNSDEKLRYSTQMRIPGFGAENQLKLKNAKVLVVGAGGLGTPVAMYLSACGVGTVGIMDNDRVEVSNLHRQVLFSSEDVSEYKVEVLKRRLLQNNPNAIIPIYKERLTFENVLERFREYDVIVDGTDNFPTTYLINDACYILKKPTVYGSIFRFEGQVSVFNYTMDGTPGPNYRDLFPTMPPTDLVPNCNDAGVIGVLPGIVGTLQANEVIKIITGKGKVLSDGLLKVDTFGIEMTILPVSPSANNPLNSVKFEFTEENYRDLSCAFNGDESAHLISSKELDALRERDQSDLQIIDVRSEEEHAEYNIGGTNIPMERLTEDPSVLTPSKKIVLYCQSGKRSMHVLQKIKSLETYQDLELYSLDRGVLDYLNAENSTSTV